MSQQPVNDNRVSYKTSALVLRVLGDELLFKLPIYGYRYMKITRRKHPDHLIAKLLKAFESKSDGCRFRSSYGNFSPFSNFSITHHTSLNRLEYCRCCIDLQHLLCIINRHSIENFGCFFIIKGMLEKLKKTMNGPS